MSTTAVWILVTIICYLIMMIVIGAVFSKKNRSSDDFYLGGRHLGPLVTAMSAEASDMSSWLLLGLPGLALITGLAEATWTAIGLAIGTYLNWLFVAKRLRIYTKRLDAVTIPDFFAKRFGDKAHILTLISAIFIVVFFVPYTASGFVGCGKLFSSIFGIDYVTAMLICALVIALYCILGGFLAASTTDFIQSIIMTIALITVLGFSFKVAGFNTIIENAKSIEGFTNIFQSCNVTDGTVGSYGALPIASTLAWGLGYFGMPHIILRFMAIEDEKKLPISRRVGSIWVVVSMSVAIFIGVCGYTLMKNGIVPSYATNADSERIIIDIAQKIASYGALPAIIGGVILAGILASAMSTADSQLLAASSSVTQNIVQEFFHVKLSQKASIILARVMVLVIAVIAVFLATNPDSSVFRIVSFAWAGFGATFGPAILFSLFWKRANLPGVLCGMIGGGVVIFVWKFAVRVAFAGTWLDIYELLPAFLVNTILVIVVSLLTKAPSKEITDEFDKVAAEAK
ncbi:MAG: sodium/proline symporter PutP [Clostridiales bacterium]|nr:sodium/proline symporter PutP [Clostridiales bacterium]